MFMLGITFYPGSVTIDEMVFGQLRHLNKLFIFYRKLAQYFLRVNGNTLRNERPYSRAKKHLSRSILVEEYFSV